MTILGLLSKELASVANQFAVIFIFLHMFPMVAEPRPDDASDPGLCPCRCKQIPGGQLVKLAMLGCSGTTDIQ